MRIQYIIHNSMKLIKDITFKCCTINFDFNTVLSSVCINTIPSYDPHYNSHLTPHTMTSSIPQVYTRNDEYTGDCASHWEDAPFPLSDFQKWAIDAYHTNKHVLVTAHTGSGKTYPAEHAIRDCVRNGRKLIYTSPIKSLSNQKFYDFQRKFPEASVGILTGDIKYNPEGNVLIMTTEILRNLVFYKRIADPTGKLTIELDIARDFHCVVFDEVHYINDEDRGRVWEETLVLLPQHIQLILLSATIDNPLDFCNWIADMKQRDVVWTSTTHRVVPLRHCLFTSFIPSYYSGKRSSDQQKNIATAMDKKLVIFDSNEHGGMNERIFEGWRGNLARVADGVSRNTIIHDCVTYLYNEDLCPAIFFTFSKVRCEALAKQTSLQMLQPNELAEVIRIVDYYIGTSPNREAYQVMTQWTDLRRCLEKGVGFHHSGLIPLFKEIVEMLYEKNLVKVLFATETFAVGVNMPTRTVVFTALEKFVNDGQLRFLHPFEYLQMAGRAGRRGIDTLGTAILLPYGRGSDPLELPECSILRNMIHGKSQFIRSKFTPDYTFILKMILNGVPLLKWISHSLYHREYAHEITMAQGRLQRLRDASDSISRDNQITDEERALCVEYTTINNRPSHLRSNTAKRRFEEIRRVKGFHQSLMKYNAVQHHQQEMTVAESECENASGAIRATLESVLSILKHYGYVTRADVELTDADVTIKGRVASDLMECHPILMTELMTDIIGDDGKNGKNTNTDQFTMEDWAGILGLFCDSQPVDRSLADMEDEYVPEHLYSVIERIQDTAHKWEASECDRKLSLGTQWKANPYMVGAMIRWADTTTSVKDIIDYYNIFEGNFIKDVLKVYNCTAEVERIAGILGKPHISAHMWNLRRVLQRSVVGVESLYVKI